MEDPLCFSTSSTSTKLTLRDVDVRTQESRSSAVGITTRLRTRRSGVRIPAGANASLCTAAVSRR